MHPATIVFKMPRRLLIKLSNKEMMAASILTFPNTAHSPFMNIENLWLNSPRFTMLCMKKSIA
jgi:hypothetical protein